MAFTCMHVISMSMSSAKGVRVRVRVPLLIPQQFLPEKNTPRSLSTVFSFSPQNTPLTVSQPLTFEQSGLLPCPPDHCSKSPPNLAKDTCGNEISEFSEIVLKVREYELDQYGVVHNAVYSSYCQHATFELLETIGVDARAVGSSGGALAFSKISLNFLAPLRTQENIDVIFSYHDASPLKSGDKFVVKTRVSQSAARLFFKNFIYKLPNKEPILEAKSVVVFLDKNYRPLRIPSDVKSKLRQFMRHDQES